MQIFNQVHGGVLTTLIDSAAFWSIFYGIDEEDAITSIDLKLNYLGRASSGTLTAKGKAIKVGKK